MIVPIGTLRTALKVELEEDDAELARLESVAVGHLEELTGYTISLKTSTLYLPGFHDSPIVTCPVNSLTSVAYQTDAGGAETLPVDNYYLDRSDGPLPVVRFIGTLPSARRGTVLVTFSAGWASGTVPEYVIQAIVALVGLMFGNANAALPIQLSDNPAYRGILDTLRCKGWLR